MKNYYAILEVPVGCPTPEIRESYRRLVQENLWNKETFAELKEAYEILTTPARRNEYDKATFGETFPSSDPAPVYATSESSLRENARHCPMGAAAQCPVINARVPLLETYCPECGFLLSAMPAQEFEPVAAPDPSGQIRLEDAAGRAHTLRPGVNTVGREATDVLLPDKTVSRRHAQIEVAEDGRVIVEDLGSTNGTRINGETLAANSARPLADGDHVQFGSVALSLRLPQTTGEGGTAEVPSSSGATPAKQEHRDPEPSRAQFVGMRGGVLRTIPLVPGVTTFGRRAENSVVLRDDPYVSGSHAQVIAEDDVFRLTDLGSTNGTLVGGKPLTANLPVVLEAGDEVAIGGTVYRFERLGLPEPPSTAEDTAATDDAGEELIPAAGETTRTEE